MTDQDDSEKLFESSLVSAFIYMCGYEDAKEGRERNESAYLANQQNKFDKLFGDLFGQVDSRFFIIEFKRERNLFEQEVAGGKAKPLRVGLYNAFWEACENPKQRDDLTWALGRFGHFGAYEQDSELRFEAYGSAVHRPNEVNALTPEASEYLKLHGSAPFTFFPPIDFQSFYDAVNADRGTRSNSQGAHWTNNADQDKFYPFYSTGLGLPASSFRSYLDTMLSFMTEDDIENMSPGRSYPNTLIGRMETRFDKLAFIEAPLDDLLNHYKKYKAILRKQAQQVKPEGRATVKVERDD